MIPPVVRLLGTAILLDTLLIAGTVPLSRFLVTILLPTGTFIGPGIIWTYSLVIFSLCFGILLFLLWMFESYYAHIFSFWQLLITMFLVMAMYVYWNRGF